MTGLLLCLLIASVAPTVGAAEFAHFTDVTVVHPSSFSGPEMKAVEMLVEEVAARTGVEWKVVPDGACSGEPCVAIASVEHPLPGLDAPVAPEKPEAFAIRFNGVDAVINGRDARGVLFGVGRLLREMRFTRGHVSLPLPPLDISTAPDTPLRGHQLGYRPKTNSYDAWTVPMWEQYIRDLIVFGTNAIELVPPRTDDAADSPHFPLPQQEMMKRMSQICADYGLDVWVWYPALDEDYTDPATVDFALKEWEGVLKDLPRLDALFVPGGDPGHTEPLVMMELLRKQAENLRRQRPELQVWMSPQGFDKEWMDTFINYMKSEQPEWLSGVVYGPQNRLQLLELRKQLPLRYAIRHYPDITHTMQCQFPVPEWDYTYAITEQRECINPRPTQYQKIYMQYHSPATSKFLSEQSKLSKTLLWQALETSTMQTPSEVIRGMNGYFVNELWRNEADKSIQVLESGLDAIIALSKSEHLLEVALRPTVGFITYSEGCNDDINKILWSAWGWDPQRAPREVINDYAAYFLPSGRARDFADGVMNLEQNWILSNPHHLQVESTLNQWKHLDRAATPQMLLNWRFQQPLYRAYYDAYIQRRAQYEARLEATALEALRKADSLGTEAAMSQAEDILRKAVTEPVAQDLRARVFELGEALYQSIRMQLSVPKYKAIHPDRGANLDLIDLPLNNRLWLMERFKEIREMATVEERQRAIDEIVHWTDPGPGGYYDDLGDPANQPHLVMPEDGYADPEFKTAPIMGREYAEGFRVSWNSYAETRYETPLQMRYDDLDGTAQYTVRVVYAGDSPEIKMRLEADGAQVHDSIDKPWPPKPIEFAIPAEAMTDGALMLSFTQPPGRGRNGRGCQVAEVWLLKNYDKAEQ